MSPRLLALWLKESIALLRDRHGLLALFIMPTIFILVMTMALRDAFTPGAAIDVSYVVVDLDRSVQSKALIKRLDKAASFRRRITWPPTPPAPRSKRAWSSYPPGARTTHWPQRSPHRACACTGCIQPIAPTAPPRS